MYRHVGERGNAYVGRYADVSVCVCVCVCVCVWACDRMYWCKCAVWGCPPYEETWLVKGRQVENRTTKRLGKPTMEDSTYIRGGWPIRWGGSARVPRLMEWTQPGQNTKFEMPAESNVDRYGRACVCVCVCVCVCACVCSENEVMFRGI